MSVQLDGSTGYLTRTATVLNYNADYTLLGQVYADQLTTFAAITSVAADSNNEDALIVASVANRLGMEEKTTGTYHILGNGATALTTVTWYHVALVRSGNDLLVYLNGVLEKQNTGNIAGRSAVAEMVLGAWDTSHSDKFTGRLYHWAAWQTALTQAEVATEVTSWPPAKATPWGYWPLTVHTDLTDGSGNARHWTANGTLATAGDPGVVVSGGWSLYRPYALGAAIPVGAGGGLYAYTRRRRQEKPDE